VAEFLERRKVVKKEKLIGGRVNTMVKNTKKKRYADAKDEDLKIVKEGQELANELQSLGNYKATKATVKEARRQAREAKKTLPSRKTGSSEDREGFNFGDLAK
jgi:hypothetical protein